MSPFFSNLPGLQAMMMTEYYAVESNFGLKATPIHILRLPRSLAYSSLSSLDPDFRAKAQTPM